MCNDAGVPVILNLEADFNQFMTNSNTTSDYNTAYESTFAEIEDNSAYDCIIGYDWEAGWPNSALWLRSYLDSIGSDRIMVTNWICDEGDFIKMVSGTPVIASFYTPGSLAGRLASVDAVAWECFAYNEVAPYAAYGVLNWVIENYPNLKLGTLSATDDEYYVAYWQDYWSAGALSGVIYPYTEQVRRAHCVLEGIRSQLPRPFDFIDVQIGDPVTTGVPSPKPLPNIYGHDVTIPYITQLEMVDDMVLTANTPQIDLTDTTNKVS